eukprot:3931710-Rhodomonas_salina.5
MSKSRLSLRAAVAASQALLNSAVRWYLSPMSNLPFVAIAASQAGTSAVAADIVHGLLHGRDELVAPYPLA